MYSERKESTLNNWKGYLISKYFLPDITRLLKHEIIIMRQNRDQELDEINDPHHVRPLRLKSVIADIDNIDGINEQTKQITQLLPHP